MDNRRRSSNGRSKILESSIQILSEFIKTKDIEEFYRFVINNTLPGELRSTSWRIFLGVLNINDSSCWAKNTKALRENYYKSCKQISDNVLKYLRNELNGEQAKTLIDQNSLHIINTVRSELKQISNNSDFFKSEIISELVVKLAYLWSINNSDFTNYNLIVPILAEMVYSLYPSILHIDISILEIDEENLENLGTQSLFYYLNTEEHFDADVFTIFDKIMNKGIKQYIMKKSLENPVDPNEIIELSKIQDEKQLLEKAKKLNKIDRILGFYLKIVNPNLLRNISSQKNEIYQTLDNLLSTLLTRNLNSEYITYFWDCIFINESYYNINKNLQFDNDFFLFIEFILLSYLVLNQDSAEKKDFEKILLNSLNSIDSRGIIKNSIKLREKINNFYF